MKIPIAVISRSSDLFRIAGFSCTNDICNELKKRIKDSLKKVILWTVEGSLQFHFKYVFAVMTHFDKSVQSVNQSSTITRPTIENAPWMVFAG